MYSHGYNRTSSKFPSSARSTHPAGKLNVFPPSRLPFQSKQESVQRAARSENYTFANRLSQLQHSAFVRAVPEDTAGHMRSPTRTGGRDGHYTLSESRRVRNSPCVFAYPLRSHSIFAGD